MRGKINEKRDALRRSSLLLIEKVNVFFEQHKHLLNSSKLKRNSLDQSIIQSCISKLHLRF